MCDSTAVMCAQYPPAEHDWLVKTAWTQGVQQARYRRYARAEAWMAVAIELAAHHAPVQQHRAAMGRAYQGVLTRTAVAERH